MINFDDVTKKHHPNWPQILDYPYRTFILWGSGSGRTNPLSDLISGQPDMDKTYLYAKDPHEAK